eukprot:3178120-Karenia_brevis.AAC.1
MPSLVTALPRLATALPCLATAMPTPRHRYASCPRHRYHPVVTTMPPSSPVFPCSSPLCPPPSSPPCSSLVTAMHPACHRHAPP